MPKDEQIEQQVQKEGEVPPPAQNGAGAAPPAGSNGAGQQASDQQQNGQQGKTVVLPQSALGRIKREERDKGAKAAKMELAKSYGFATVEELDAFLKGAKNSNKGDRMDNSQNRQAKPQNGKPAGDPGPAPDGMSRKAQAAWEREREKMSRELEAAKRQAAHNDKKYRQAKRQVEDRDTEMALQRSAMLTGVKDVDYAIRLLNRHVENKTEQELEGFDEVKFFEGLRSTHSYLFGETVKPATTGVGGGTAPPPAPKPEDAAKAAGQNGMVDANKLDRKAFDEMLRKRGLNPTL
jgi:hypothetical protein